MISSKFAGVQNERDPLLGTRSPLLNAAPTDRFLRPDESGVTDVTEAMPKFVTVRGGGYFFMPGIRALKYLASLTPNPDDQPK